MKKNLLPSYAYHLGGWNKVKGILRDAETVEHLIRESDGGEYHSPILWTSSDMTWAGAFGNPDATDGVFTVIRPDPTRTVVRLFNNQMPNFDAL